VSARTRKKVAVGEKTRKMVFGMTARGRHEQSMKAVPQIVTIERSAAAKEKRELRLLEAEARCAAHLISCHGAVIDC